MRPVILLDCDGPMTDGFFARFCSEIRAAGYEQAQPHLITSWDVGPSFPEIPRDVVAAAYQKLRSPGICSSFEPNEGAREFVESIRKWAQVLAVTAPMNGSATWANERDHWLVDRLGFKIEEVISARDKTHVAGDVLIDDKVSTIKAWKARWPESEAILWTLPHNVREAWNPRASDYFDLLGLLAPLKERYASL